MVCGCVVTPLEVGFKGHWMNVQRLVLAWHDPTFSFMIIALIKLRCQDVWWELIKHFAITVIFVLGFSQLHHLNQIEVYNGTYPWTFVQESVLAHWRLNRVCWSDDKLCNCCSLAPRICGFSSWLPLRMVLLAVPYICSLWNRTSPEQLGIPSK